MRAYQVAENCCEMVEFGISLFSVLLGRLLVL